MSADGFSLENRVAVVTGASSGIGAAAARALGAAGGRVVLVGRDRERLGEAAAAVEATGAEAHLVSADVTDGDGPGRIVAASLERFGAVDVLVHAAGVFLPTPFAETTDEALDQQWDVNLRAPYRLTREALPHLGRGGSVVFISSNAGHVGFPNSTAYCASKGAVELLVKALAMELAPRGIKVNAVAPGNVHTKMNAHLFADPEYTRQMLATTPAGRVGEVDDIAPAIVFLASPAADYIHGASLLVDGGWVAA